MSSSPNPLHRPRKNPVLTRARSQGNEIKRLLSVHSVDQGRITRRTPATALISTKRKTEVRCSQSCVGLGGVAPGAGDSRTTVLVSVAAGAAPGRAELSTGNLESDVTARSLEVERLASPAAHLRTSLIFPKDSYWFRRSRRLSPHGIGRKRQEQNPSGYSTTSGA